MQFGEEAYVQQGCPKQCAHEQKDVQEGKQADWVIKQSTSSND